MQNHTKVYMEYFGYTIADTILCEVCNAPANSIHHVIHRSKFGSKRKHEQDRVENLIALCHFHHDLVHARSGGHQLNEKIKEIVKNRV